MTDDVMTIRQMCDALDALDATPALCGSMRPGNPASVYQA